MPDAMKYVPERNVRDNLKGELRQIWDFDVNGGAIGVANLDVLVPDGAIITGGHLLVLEAVTSAGLATLSVGLNTNTDLLGATAVASLTAGAVIDLIPKTTPVLLTAERELKVAVATAAMTGGKVAVYFEFIGPAKDIEPVTYRKA